MDEDLKKLGRFIAQKIEDAKEEILESLEESMEQVVETKEAEEEEAELEKADEFDIFDEAIEKEDYKGKRKVELKKEDEKIVQRKSLFGKNKEEKKVTKEDDIEF